MNKQITIMIVWVFLIAGNALSLSAQNYGKPYQPFPAYERGVREVSMSSMPSAKISGTIGASSAYMHTTTLPQGEIYEPFSATTPSGVGPRRAPGEGGTNKTDTPNPGLPIGDGLGVLLVLGLLYIMAKYVIRHTKNDTFLAKCHDMIE